MARFFYFSLTISIKWWIENNRLSNYELRFNGNWVDSIFFVNFVFSRDFINDNKLGAVVALFKYLETVWKSKWINILNWIPTVFVLFSCFCFGICLFIYFSVSIVSEFNQILPQNGRKKSAIQCNAQNFTRCFLLFLFFLFGVKMFELLFSSLFFPSVLLEIWKSNINFCRSIKLSFSLSHTQYFF